MDKKRFLFTAGERLRGLRALTGLKRPAFGKIVGMKAKTIENIERGVQRMRDEDFERVCTHFPDFTRWIAYEGPVDRVEVEWKVADSAQRAAVYLVEQHPGLLRSADLDLEEWRSRHAAVLQGLREDPGRWLTEEWLDDEEEEGSADEDE
ncbi:helix-turn-helix domain-containing protein [Pseudomonas citronellolis]|uniref:helix-turn-helix domain-containing protein n=1 Tax=Pseudomonas citronellolis TaxID=53408 RepID=UPI0023E46052|nr:helix-turn-helix transcriptional regulator [Pseudomonas citronellolis]MDF3931058.1 helix-turn-helix transcriptional regulator [Pseudomonas citronellolis]